MRARLPIWWPGNRLFSRPTVRGGAQARVFDQRWRLPPSSRRPSPCAMRFSRFSARTGRDWMRCTCPRPAAVRLGGAWSSNGHQRRRSGRGVRPGLDHIAHVPRPNGRPRGALQASYRCRLAGEAHAETAGSCRSRGGPGCVICESTLSDCRSRSGAGGRLIFSSADLAGGVRRTDETQHAKTYVKGLAWRCGTCVFTV